MEEESFSNPDLEVASVLATEHNVLSSHHADKPTSQSLPCFKGYEGLHQEQSPFRPSTVLTNLSRGNTATVTPGVPTMQSIHYLAGQGEIELLKTELTKLSIDEVDEYGFTPLIWACAYNQYKTAEFLISKEADVTHKGSQGETALSVAADTGNERTLQFLVKDCMDCDVNVIDKVGNSPLLYAVAGNHLKSVKILLDNGADITHRNSEGLSAFDIALSCGHFEIQRELEKYMLSLLENS